MTLHLGDDDYQRVRQIALRDGVTLSTVIRTAVHLFVSNEPRWSSSDEQDAPANQENGGRS
jgi:hypothetical protein